MLPISFHYISLIPKVSVFTLTISCLNTNLTWFIDLNSQIPMQYCSFQHWTLLSPLYMSPVWHAFWFSLFTGSRAMPLAFASNILVTYYPVEWEGLIIQCHIFLTFCTIHGVLCHSLLFGLHFVRPLHRDLSILGGPARHGLYFTELHKTVIQVIILLNFMWFWFSFWRSQVFSSCFSCLFSVGWG